MSRLKNKRPKNGCVQFPNCSDKWGKLPLKFIVKDQFPGERLL